MLFPGGWQPPARGILLRERVEVVAGGEAAVTLTQPPLEEIELVFAEGPRRPEGGSFWIRYEAAQDLRAAEYPVPERGPARVEVVAGEPFLVETAAGGLLRPLKVQDRGVPSGLARYMVGGR